MQIENLIIRKHMHGSGPMITAVRPLTVDEYRRLSFRYCNPVMSADTEQQFIDDDEWTIVELYIDDKQYMFVQGWPGDEPCGAAIELHLAYGEPLDYNDPRVINIHNSWRPKQCMVDPACICATYDEENMPSDEESELAPCECPMVRCQVCKDAMHPVMWWYQSRWHGRNTFNYTVDM